MGLESVAGIWDLNRNWPLGSDDRSTSDNHIRNIKNGILNTFPNISSTITASADEINALDGADENIQDKLNSFSASLLGINAELSDMSLSLSAANTQITNNTASISALNSLAEYVEETYMVVVDASATALIIPGGWSVTVSSSGVYLITHNLGFSAGYSSAHYLLSGAIAWGSVASAGLNSVKVQFRDQDELRDSRFWMQLKVL